MADYQILTDATADLSEELAESLGITVIPMILDMDGMGYTIGGKNPDITIPEFYARLEKGEVARTSQINLNVYQQYFEEVLKQGKDVLLISFTSGLSKSYEVARMCVDNLQAEYPERKLYCVDSLCASVGEGLLVYAAARQKSKGLTVDELAKWVEDHKKTVAHWVTVDALNYLQRGGRISVASAAVGTMLNIKPIIYVNHEGKLISVNKVRGRKKALETLAAAFRENWTRDPDETVFIGCGTVKDDAETLKNILLENGAKDVLIDYVGPIIGAHTGPSVIVLSFFGDHR